MSGVTLNVIVLGLGAAALLDMGIGFASGLLQLADADRTLVPNQFWRCMMGEAVITMGAVAWFCFAATLWRKLAELHQVVPGTSRPRWHQTQ